MIVMGKNVSLELRAKDGITSQLMTQTYIPATGLTPNTSFLPLSILDDRDYVNNPTDSRLKAQGAFLLLVTPAIWKTAGR